MRAFFANGGDRCWVVRVAGDQARSNRFPLQGLYRVPPLPGGGGSAAPASAAARSKGSWSDPLRVSTRLRSRPVRITAARGTKGGPLELEVTESPPPAVGDLLRVVVQDPPVTAYVVEQSTTRKPGGHRTLVASRGAILTSGDPLASPPGPLGAPAGTGGGGGGGGGPAPLPEERASEPVVISGAALPGLAGVPAAEVFVMAIWQSDPSGTGRPPCRSAPGILHLERTSGPTLVPWRWGADN